jgi:hypothetical protein
MNEPRPAMISARPPESRSSVANAWKTRTGSSELRTLTALVRRMRRVRVAAAASTTAGAETVKSGRWCSPTPNTSSPTWSASSISSISRRNRSAGSMSCPVSGSAVRSPKL